MKAHALRFAALAGAVLILTRDLPHLAQLCAALAVTNAALWLTRKIGTTDVDPV